jgi:hypothetical protein
MLILATCQVEQTPWSPHHASEMPQGQQYRPVSETFIASYGSNNHSINYTVERYVIALILNFFMHKTSIRLPIITIKLFFL